MSRQKKGLIITFFRVIEASCFYPMTLNLRYHEPFLHYQLQD